MRKQRYSRIIASTMVLLALLMVCFVITIQMLHSVALERCYDTLDDTTEQTASTLRYNLMESSHQLELFGDMLPEYFAQDAETTKQVMDIICSSRPIDSLCIQLPDGRLITGGAMEPAFSALPSFREMVGKLPFTSGKFPGKPGSEAWYLYQAVPVQRDGETVAILYGFLNLEILPSFFHITAYDGQSELYLVDGDTGDFLMDTWHDDLGNIYDDTMKDRQTKPGYDMESMRQGVVNGEKGYFVFRSETSGEFFYTCYHPAGINNWSVQVTVPESAVFADAERMNYMIYTMAGVLIATVLVYIFGIVFQQQRVNRENRQRLKQTSYMYEVQQILFEAHEKPERITDALERVADTLEAEAVILISLKNGYAHDLYRWVDKNGKATPEVYGRSLKKDFPSIFSQLWAGRNVLYYESDSTSAPEIAAQEREELRRTQVDSLMSVPLMDTDGRIEGILYGVNLHEEWRDCTFLESIAGDFLMALHNLESYRAIHNMGMLDAITGLRNRNSYEQMLPQYGERKEKGLHCVYIDVNGLHEVNNRYGHKAGDTMLRTIGEQVMKQFGSEHVYRIGGDEFIAFALSGDLEDIRDRADQVKTALEAVGYYISLGCAFQRGDSFNLERLVSQAEEEMYRDKQAFYRDKGSHMELRGRNKDLEKLLQQKQDMDTFFDLLSTYYLAVYVVNLRTDTTRVLNRPQRFASLLEKNNEIFSGAIRDYCEKYVRTEDQAGFQAFCDYQWIQQELTEGRRPKFYYTRPDQAKVMIHVYPSRNFSSETPETFWIFEQYTET